MRPRFLALLALLLLVVPGNAAAQGWGGSVSVAAVSGGEAVEGAELTRGAPIKLIANVSVPQRENTTWRAFLNASVDGEPIEQLPNTSRPIENGGSTSFAAQFTAPNTTGNASITYTLTVQYRQMQGNRTGNQTDNGTGSNATDGNQTAGWQDAEGFPQEGQISFTVARLAPPPQPSLPWGWILGIGAVVVAGGGGVLWYSRRDRQIRGRARSQAMQDLEGESFEKDEPTEGEAEPQLKILQARAEDIRRMIDLAKERYEDGDLTEHQYETIRERKETELEEIEQQIDEHREGGTA